MDALGGRVTEWLIAAPEDPFVLIGLMVAAWLPVCATALAFLSILATAQYHFFVRRRRPRLGFALPPPSQRPLVTRRVITTRRHMNGPLAAARLAVAVVLVLVVSVVVVASSGPRLLASLGG